MDEEILPEDDSVFGNLSERRNNYSSDALLEDSFSEFTGAGATSTPSVTTRKRTGSTHQSASPPSNSRSSPSAEVSSPSRTTRSSSRIAHSRLALPGSPATGTRSATSASPVRTTRSSCRTATSTSVTASPSRTTRSSSRIAASPSRSCDTTPQAGRSSLPSATSKKSQQKEKPASRLKFPKCPSTLANKRNLDIHLRTHLMQGVSSRAPNRDQIIKEMPRLIDELLDDLIREPVIGEISAVCHQYCVDLLKNIKEDVTGEASEMFSFLCDHFCEIMKGKKALFSSSITSTIYKETNKLLSSNDFLATINGHLTALCDCEVSTVNVVVGNFFFLLSQKIIVFTIKTMRSSLAGSEVVRKKRSEDNLNDVDFQQLVYHIGGSIVHGFLWKGRKYSQNSATWTSFCEVLKSKFIVCDDKSNQCSEAIRFYTEKMDRGGLTHLSNAAYDFFLMLFDFLMSLEAEDGSLPPREELLNNNVLQNDVLLCLWDVLVGDDLGELDALDLLVQITECGVRVTMKGILKRKLNEDLKKAYNSVALRSRLAK